MPRRRTLRILLVAVALVAAACSGGGSEGATATTTTGGATSDDPSTTDPSTPPVEVTDRIRIEVLSSQPDRVTGDDARIRVTPSDGGEAAALRISIDGRDVTASFVPTDQGGSPAVEGVVTGLVEGTNTLTATDGGESETLRLRAWPRQGPMISGPQTPLPVCATEAAGLGAPTGDSCSAPTKVTWRAITDDGAAVPLDDPRAPAPEGTAEASVDGDDVPAVVRVEQGVIDRSTYALAVLDRQPGGTDADLVPAWNGRLVFRFSGGCGAGHAQGLPGAPAVDPALLVEGYAVVTASFTSAGVQCNDVVASETVMMVRERVVELLGQIELTIADGEGFGGAMAHLMVQNYPTLLDGVVTVDAYADTTSTVNQIADCTLLERYYRTEGARDLDERARAAVNGHPSTATCATAARDLGTMFDPTACDPAVPADDVYDAETNPDGLRCTYQDLNVVPFGTDEATGTAVRPLDNTGVQYGLEALNRGTITVEQFLDLNEQVGGLDLDGAPTARRAEVDPIALQFLYENGRVAAGLGDLRRVPIIDIVHGGEGAAPADLHQALALRARLSRGARGDTAPGHQIWAVDPSSPGTRVDAIAAVDTWLTAMASSADAAALRSERPDDALSRCGSDPAQVGVDVFDVDEGACLDADAPLADPRIVAGGPITADIIKCELKPVDERDYEVSLTSTQYDRLIGIFPDGVCNWDLTGAGQTFPTMPDRSFDEVEIPADLA